MFSLRLRTVYHRNIFFSGLVLMAIGLPFSKSLMSISQFVLIGNWIWEGDLKNKLKMFRHNKAALILSSLPLLYVFGLIYTSDFDYALNDIRIKLPLLVLPLIFSSSYPLAENRFFLLMRIFSLAVIAASFYSMFAYFGFTQKNIDDIRDISVFMSHIRFSLLICVSILFLVYSVINIPATKMMQYLQLAAAAWLVIFLFSLESLTGIIALSSAAFSMFIVFSFKQSSLSLKFFYLSVLLMFPVLFAAFLYMETKNYFSVNPIDLSKLEEFSDAGEQYLHDTSKKEIENGNYVWLYVAPAELESEWDKRSEIKFSEKDLKGQNLSFTLVRFLSSKGLRKDAEGVQKLTGEEIKAIQHGIANSLYMQSGIRVRIREIIWEFDNYFSGGNPQGNSVTQRLEFWKAAWNGIKQNAIFGVGSGDLKREMNTQYTEIKTMLSPEYWLKPHNQFITITLTFGFFGLAWFLIFLFAPGFFQKQFGEFFYTTFFIIAFLSMFTEDTLDTQAGISFFAFFSCLFLFRKNSSY